MSQDFRNRYGLMRENDPTRQEENESVATERYSTQSHVRNIVFVLRDGPRYFLNYSYLVCTEQQDNETLLLHFTTHLVQLTGKRLDVLFLDLADHLPRIIGCTEPRYDLLTDDLPVVHEIIITATG
ncbi:MAG TPA: hypothetical protein VL098_08440 [Flavipsychrobacter sp.]|nr:hypothetical protein [Flavipsychrobacter sp.]